MQSIIQKCNAMELWCFKMTSTNLVWMNEFFSTFICVGAQLINNNLVFGLNVMYMSFPFLIQLEYLSKAFIESIEGFVHFAGNSCNFQIHFLFCVAESKK